MSRHRPSTWNGRNTKILKTKDASEARVSATIIINDDKAALEKLYAVYGRMKVCDDTLRSVDIAAAIPGHSVCIAAV